MDETASSPTQASDDAARASLDPRTADPRELMRVLLPPARREYVKAWEWLADANTPLDKRRAGRARADAIAADHALVAGALRERERSLTGDDLLNARHLAGELERHVEAFGRIATISPLGLQGSKELRPEALGCGRQYRDPAKAGSDAQAAATRGGSSTPKAAARDPRGRGGRDDRDAKPRDPKPPRDMLGSSKHDSALGDDMDEATRAKLEALRKALEG